MNASPTQTGTLSIRYDETTAGFQNSLGYYLVDTETGAITDVGMVFANQHALSPGESFEISVPPGSQIGTFLIANGNNANDFSRFEDGSFRFIDPSTGDPATLGTSNPQLQFVGADGEVTSLNGNIWHSAGFGDAVGLNRDGEVHLRGLESNDDGSFTFGWEDLAAPGWDQDFSDVVMTVSLSGPGLTFLNPDFAVVTPAVVPCFVTGSEVLTPAGLRPVEALCPGDRVLTRDNGAMPVVRVLRRRLSAAILAARPELRPLRVRAGALGDGLPAHDVWVSPQHRLLVTSPRAELYCGEHEVLVPAAQLVGMPGIDRAAAGPVEYVHLLFEGHELVCSGGLWSESFQPGQRTLAGFGAEQRAELQALFPELTAGAPAFPAARATLRRRETALILGRAAA